MITFLFWNTKRKTDLEIGPVIKEMLVAERPDIFLIAECGFSNELIEKDSDYKLVHEIKSVSFGVEKNMKIFSSQKEYTLSMHSEYGNCEMLVCSLQKGKCHILIFGCHFVSKASLDNIGKRTKRFGKYKEFIETAEEAYSINILGKKGKLNGSIAFGDFNTNPFEEAFNDTDGLLAFDYGLKKVEKTGRRKYFLNPTLSIMGNFGHRKTHLPAAPGTYYFKKKDIEIATEFFWNALDGMIFRPDLIDLYLKGEPLEVVTEVKDPTGTIKYLLFDDTTKTINSSYSDHLPIKFSFNI